MAKIVKTCWLTVDGEPVYVEKKKIKHMYLRVAKPDGTIRISAPAGMSDQQVCKGEKRLDPAGTAAGSAVRRKGTDAGGEERADRSLPAAASCDPSPGDRNL